MKCTVKGNKNYGHIQVIAE